MTRRTLVLLSTVLVVVVGCQRAVTETSEAPTGSPADATALPQQASPAAQESAAATPDLLPNLREPLEGVISGGQPTPAQLLAARDAGYKTVINFRLPDEPGAADEAEVVSGLGMEYVSIPIPGSAGLTRENAEAFAKALKTVEYPIVLHCGSGNRIGALFALKAFWLEGKSVDEAMQIGIDSGLTRLEGAVKELLEAESGA